MIFIDLSDSKYRYTMKYTEDPDIFKITNGCIILYKNFEKKFGNYDNFKNIDIDISNLMDNPNKKYIITVKQFNNNFIKLYSLENVIDYILISDSLDNIFFNNVHFMIVLYNMSYLLDEICNNICIALTNYKLFYCDIISKYAKNYRNRYDKFLDVYDMIFRDLLNFIRSLA
jgi:hypothetical protein